jgi:Homeodomain
MDKRTEVDHVFGRKNESESVVFNKKKDNEYSPPRKLEPENTFFNRKSENDVLYTRSVDEPSYSRPAEDSLSMYNRKNDGMYKRKEDTFRALSEESYRNKPEDSFRSMSEQNFRKNTEDSFSRKNDEFRPKQEDYRIKGEIDRYSAEGFNSSIDTSKRDPEVYDQRIHGEFNAFHRNSSGKLTNALFAPLDSKPRNRTTPYQLEVLEKVAKTILKPDKALRQKLSNDLGMSQRQVQIWFQNRRAKLKKTSYADEDGSTSKETAAKGYRESEFFDTINSNMPRFPQDIAYENIDTYNNPYPRKDNMYYEQQQGAYPYDRRFQEQSGYFENNLFKNSYYNAPEEVKTTYSYYNESFDPQRIARNGSKNMYESVHQPRQPHYNGTHYRK